MLKVTLICVVLRMEESALSANPKVSVIVPVYKVLPYLNTCLKSLARQTFRDFEVLIINDGSPDESQKMINIYCREFPDIFKSFIKPNGGLSDARNYGIERAKGEYIAFVDSDDYVSVDMIESLYTAAVSENADLVICDFTKFTRNSEKVYRKTHELTNRKYVNITKHMDVSASIFERPEYLRYASSYAWNKLYHRDLFFKTGLRFPKQWFEDSAVVYNIISCAERIAFVNKSLYRYRIDREGSITNTFDKRMYDIFTSCSAIIDYYNERGLMAKFHNEVEYLCIMHLHARLIALKSCRNYKMQKEFIRKCYKFLDDNFPLWRSNKYYIWTKEPKIISNNYIGFEAARDSETKMLRYFRCRALLEFIYKYFWYKCKKLKKRLKKKNKKTVTQKPTIDAFLPPEQVDFIAKAEKTIKKIHKEFEEYNKTDLTYLEQMTIKSEEKKERKLNSKSSMRATHEVKRIQEYALDIMDTIHNFCEENGLNYYLAEGSLLGAVRHHGFIPWDDDMDICMPRADYEKFISLWGKQRINKCEMLNNVTYKKYYLPFTKIVLTENVGFYNNKKFFPEKYWGPFVDIFPLDETIPTKSSELLMHTNAIRKYRDYLLVKIKYISKGDKFISFYLKSKFTSFASLQKKLHTLETEYQGNSYGLVCNFCSSYPPSKETFNKMLFDKKELVDFDGRKFYIPAGYDEILTTIYGQYMTPPPPEKQISRHTYKVDRKLRKKIEEEK